MNNNSSVSKTKTVALILCIVFYFLGAICAYVGIGLYAGTKKEIEAGYDGGTLQGYNEILNMGSIVIIIVAGILFFLASIFTVVFVKKELKSLKLKSDETKK